MDEEPDRLFEIESALDKIHTVTITAIGEARVLAERQAILLLEEALRVIEKLSDRPPT